MNSSWSVLFVLTLVIWLPHRTHTATFMRNSMDYNELKPNQNAKLIIQNHDFESRNMHDNRRKRQHWDNTSHRRVLSSDGTKNVLHAPNDKNGFNWTYATTVNTHHFKRHRHHHNHHRHGNYHSTLMRYSSGSISDLFVENGDISSSNKALNDDIHWPVKKEAIMEGDLILGGLMMVHSREDTMMCGQIIPQGGIQALEAMLYTLDRINENGLLPNIRIGAHILDYCDRDSYGLEMAVDFIKAYMAPEVFTKTNSDGHGRAADIWSVGCVVIEMASGKRPWSQFDSNFQIMFKVGMGETPEAPPTLSQEGHDFLDHCLEHDPKVRWTAMELLQHHFCKWTSMSIVDVIHPRD